MKVVTGQSVSEGKLIAAKALRQHMTQAETILWRHLRGNKLGVHFRRQQIIRGFIADFYCFSANLVVECDGPIHSKAYDDERDQIFVEEAIVVLRFRNEEIYSQTATVINRIRAALPRMNHVNFSSLQGRRGPRSGKLGLKSLFPSGKKGPTKWEVRSPGTEVSADAREVGS